MISEQPRTDAATPPATPAPTWADFHELEDRLDRGAATINTWTIFIWAFAAVALVLSIIGLAFGSGTTPVAAVSPAASVGPVTLTDFHVQTAATAVGAGLATFQITNGGAVQHELLVFRSDLAPSAYPMKDGNIDEESPAITKVSDGDNLLPAGTQSRTVDLSKPGTYLFVCNLPGHFKAGMFSVVTVK